MSTTAKVPWYDKIIHSMYGACSFQVSWAIFGYYLVYFYTDVVGLSATVAGMIMLAARFADCFTDPGRSLGLRRCFCSSWECLRRCRRRAPE